MSPSAHAVSLVAQLGVRLGVTGLSFDEYNLFHVLIDGVFIDVQLDTEKEVFLISSEVTSIASASAADIYAYLLELNLVSGMSGKNGFIGLNRRSEQLFFIDRIAGKSLAVDEFEDFLRRSGRLASAWTKLVNSPDFVHDALSGHVPEGSYFQMIHV